ncbi:MAG: hypothetical protein RL518_191 [Pseudomonadota bacterium]|jgi:uncharacterized protein with von Willebrand factor type A (vWA) domain
MNWSNGGDFTKSLLSLQLQLQTLLEGVGGEETAGLLDGLAQLSEAERSLVIPRLTRTIHQIAKSDKRLLSDKDREMKQFEDSLFEGVMEALKHEPSAQRESSEPGPKLAVLSGGKHKSDRASQFKKPVRIPTLIDLAKARESRRNRTDSSPRDIV